MCEENRPERCINSAVRVTAGVSNSWYRIGSEFAEANDLCVSICQRSPVMKPLTLPMTFFCNEIYSTLVHYWGKAHAAFTSTNPATNAMSQERLSATDVMGARIFKVKTSIRRQYQYVPKT